MKKNEFFVYFVSPRFYFPNLIKSQGEFVQIQKRKLI
jgi:hypothetical protein